MKKATLAISDMHFGDSAQLYRTLQHTMRKGLERIIAFDPDEVEILINGDAVAGRGVYRLQEAQNVVQLGPEQIYWAGWEINGWHLHLNRPNKHGTYLTERTKWVILKGNHDHSKKENLAQQLVMFLKLLRLDVKYIDRTYTGFFGEEGNSPAFEAEHGFGRASGYYAASYAEIRACWQKYIEHYKVDGVDVSRFLRAHIHQFNVGQQIGMDCCIDTTGGWHRNERMSLSSVLRPTGFLVYLWDSDAEEKLEVVTIEADRQLWLDETYSVGLAYRNMAAAGKALSEVAHWGSAEGIW